MIKSPRITWFGGFSFVLAFALHQSAYASLNISLNAGATDLSQLVVGDTFTINITISTSPVGEANGLGMSAFGGSGLTATNNFSAPASIFNFSPSVPFGGISNTPGALGLKGDGTVKLFEGALSPGNTAAGGGPDIFSVEFTATSIGSGTITVGKIVTDTTFGPIDFYRLGTGADGVYNNGTLSYSVGAGGGGSAVPEPATIAVWSILGLCGVGYGVRRKMKKTA